MFLDNVSAIINGHGGGYERLIQPCAWFTSVPMPNLSVWSAPNKYQKGTKSGLLFSNSYTSNNMQPESTVVQLPTLTPSDKEAVQYPYLQGPLRVEEVFEETNGKDLGDVLRKAVRKVSIGDVNQSPSTLTDRVTHLSRRL